jgi:ABC-type uncharacterized transport system substrate-binding protein
MAAELVALKPDVLLIAGASAAMALQRARTTMIPIVFIAVPDLIASKLVDSLAQLGGNATRLPKIL